MIELNRRPGEGRALAVERITSAVHLPEPDRNCAVCRVNILLHHLHHLTNWCPKFKEPR